MSTIYRSLLVTHGRFKTNYVLNSPKLPTLHSLSPPDTHSSPCISPSHNGLFDTPFSAPPSKQTLGTKLTSAEVQPLWGLNRCISRNLRLVRCWFGPWCLQEALICAWLPNAHISQKHASIPTSHADSTPTRESPYTGGSPWKHLKWLFYAPLILVSSWSHP